MVTVDEGVISGAVYRHTSGGLHYFVQGVRQSTDGYELAHQLNGNNRVNYVQLEQGGCPPGTKWNKDEQEFQAAFELKLRLPKILCNPFIDQVLLWKVLKRFV